jgi:hypothetical protein
MNEGQTRPAPASVLYALTLMRRVLDTNGWPAPYRRPVEDDAQDLIPVVAQSCTGAPEFPEWEHMREQLPRVQSPLRDEPEDEADSLLEGVLDVAVGVTCHRRPPFKRSLEGDAAIPPAATRLRQGSDVRHVTVRGRLIAAIARCRPSLVQEGE